MSSLSFEWDDRKNTSNQEEHGVSFDEAKTVFADELVRERRAFYPYGTEFQAQYLNSLPLRKRLKYYRIISAGRADGLERIQYEGYHHA